LRHAIRSKSQSLFVGVKQCRSLVRNTRYISGSSVHFYELSCVLACIREFNPQARSQSCNRVNKYAVPADATHLATPGEHSWRNQMGLCSASEPSATVTPFVQRNALRGPVTHAFQSSQLFLSGGRMPSLNMRAAVVNDTVTTVVSQWKCRPHFLASILSLSSYEAHLFISLLIDKHLVVIQSKSYIPTRSGQVTERSSWLEIDQSSPIGRVQASIPCGYPPQGASCPLPMRR
jgi:hypothetical protein